jgi:hypothetical protein
MKSISISSIVAFAFAFAFVLFQCDHVQGYSFDFRCATKEQYVAPNQDLFHYAPNDSDDCLYLYKTQSVNNMKNMHMHIYIHIDIDVSIPIKSKNTNISDPTSQMNIETTFVSFFYLFFLLFLFFVFFHVCFCWFQVYFRIGHFEADGMPFVNPA